jgi:hypothetical protein
MIIGGGKTNFDGLKPFAGMNVIVEFLPDTEASRAAASIVGIIKAAGWNVVRIDANTELEDGVVILSPPGVRAMETAPAADALLDLLTSNNWEAHTFPEVNIPDKTIKVTVGFKPSPYFFPQEMKDEMKRIREIDKKARKSRDDAIRRMNELMEQLKKPPQ